MDSTKSSLAHTFVSYSHENKWELDAVLNRLRLADIPVWYDASLEAGEGWKPQIDSALDESFAVIVAITPESMKSQYVTYEWSWAIGHGIPVIPLLLKGGFEQIHKRLLDEHVQDCRGGIPDSVIETIKSKQAIPPEVEYLNNDIRGMLAPLRIQWEIMIWLDARTDKMSDSDRNFLKQFRLVNFWSYRSKIVNSELPKFIIDNSHALTMRQKLKLREIMKVIKPTNTIGELTDFYQNKLTPVLGELGHWYDFNDEVLTGYLASPPSETGGFTSPDEFALLASEVVDVAFGERKDYADKVWAIIQRIHDSQFPKPKRARKRKPSAKHKD